MASIYFEIIVLLLSVGKKSLVLADRVSYFWDRFLKTNNSWAWEECKIVGCLFESVKI